MQILTGKSIPRRTFLRGMGATVALPYLDAMTPAFSAFGKAGAAAAATNKTRLVCIESVHGAAGSNAWGATRNLWAPAKVGREFELIADGALPSLEPWRKYLTIVSNTDVRMAEAFDAPEIGGDHFRSSAVFLTQSHPKQTQGSDLFVGTSLDQIIARHIGQDTAVPSMQLCIENLDQAGGCYYNYACAYTDTISWANPSEPLPMIRNPRAAFELLFGAGKDNADRVSRRKANQRAGLRSETYTGSIRCGQNQSDFSGPHQVDTRPGLSDLEKYFIIVAGDLDSFPAECGFKF